MSLSDVMASYDSIRLRNEQEQQRRRNEVYERVPQLADLHQQINNELMRRLKHAIDGVETDKHGIQIMIDKAQALLTEAGFDQNYLNPIVSCADCRDTGTRDDFRRCDCLKKRILEDKLDEARLTDNGVSFELFDPEIFSDEQTENGYSQRNMMCRIKQHCEKYADSFPDCAHILIFTGGIGLGKTYLTKCIMRRIIEQGHTAAYYTAYRLFSCFHRDRIGEEVDLSPFFDAPLLIIDDLGTEPMTRNVTREYFFDLLNERIAGGKHTLISTNLPLEELNERYGERIHSRLMDVRHSEKIIFKGRDVRY